LASPVGHALVGLGLAAAVTQITKTASSPALWIGAVVASGVADLDLTGVMFGLPRRRIHRYATHSFLVLGVLILVAAWACSRLVGSVDQGIVFAWAAALLSHPLLDLISTGPTAGGRGCGIALFWPLSSRRWFLRHPLLPSREFTSCQSVGEIWRAIGFEVCCLGPLCIFIVLLCYIV